MGEENQGQDPPASIHVLYLRMEFIQSRHFMLIYPWMVRIQYNLGISDARVRLMVHLLIQANKDLSTERNCQRLVTDKLEFQVIYNKPNIMRFIMPKRDCDLFFSCVSNAYETSDSRVSRKYCWCGWFTFHLVGCSRSNLR